jgi:NADPH2:quinone reductase
VIALVTGPQRAAGLDLIEVDEPDPACNEALVAVRSSSINRGELRLMAMRPNGWIPGQDVAGVVERAASDGPGPVVGARVAALVDQSGWAERVAVPTDRLAELPANVSFGGCGDAAEAGTTAMRALRLGGNRAWYRRPSPRGRRYHPAGLCHGEAVGRVTAPIASKKSQSPN